MRLYLVSFYRHEVVVSFLTYSIIQSKAFKVSQKFIAKTWVSNDWPWLIEGDQWTILIGIIRGGVTRKKCRPW